MKRGHRGGLLPYLTAAPAACCSTLGPLQLPLHTPKIATLGPSHAHTIGMVHPREAGAGARPAEILESGPRSPGCDLEEGLAVGFRWYILQGPWTPRPWGAAQLEGQDRVFQSMGTTAGVPLAWVWGLHWESSLFCRKLSDSGVA